MKGRHGFNATVALCARGLVLDGGGDGNLYVIQYRDVRAYSISEFEIHVKTAQRDDIRVICRSPIKLKAVSDAFRKKAKVPETEPW